MAPILSYGESVIPTPQLHGDPRRRLAERHGLLGFGSGDELDPRSYLLGEIPEGWFAIIHIIDRSRAGGLRAGLDAAFGGDPPLVVMGAFDRASAPLGSIALRVVDDPAPVPLSASGVLLAGLLAGLGAPRAARHPGGAGVGSEG